MSTRNLRELSNKEIKNWLTENGEKTFRFTQINSWLWKQPVKDFDSMLNISKSLREKLKSSFKISAPSISQKQVSKDGTIKLGFRLEDGLFIEGVLIPSPKRITACISTQAGCRMGCKFCATASLGFKRNLTTEEIYLHTFELNKLSKEHFGSNVSNIVIMGMGEPLDNYDATVAAVRHITSEEGMAMSPRRITISTSGVIPGIKRLAEEELGIHLSVSLHSANEKTRSRIMPINNKYNLEELAKTLQEFHKKTNIRISYEYLLLDGVNDSLKDAKELAEFTKITPCKINLIEYNPVKGISFAKSDSKNTENFIHYLNSRNLIVNVRRSRGSDVDAACGQLANKIQKK